MMFVVIYLILINVLAFFAMAYDKKLAREHKLRVPESTLLLLAVVGGSLGMLLGMKAFRHKTKKAKFFITVPLCLAVQAALAADWFCFEGKYLRLLIGLFGK